MVSENACDIEPRLMMTFFFAGKEGPVTLALLNFLLEDMKAGPASIRIPVPYGVANSQSVK